MVLLSKFLYKFQKVRRSIYFTCLNTLVSHCEYNVILIKNRWIKYLIYKLRITSAVTMGWYQVLPKNHLCHFWCVFLARSVPFGIDPSSGIVTVEWEGEGEGEGPDWKTSYSLHVAATDGEQEILAPLVIRDGYHTRSYHPLKTGGI